MGIREWLTGARGRLRSLHHPSPITQRPPRPRPPPAPPRPAPPPARAPRPRPPPTGVELVTTAARAAGELTQIGITVGRQMLKRATQRLPRR